jgi:phosphoglycerate dehydrogenase-like enzyme
MPKAIYVDIDDTDLSPGRAILEDAGFEVSEILSRDPDQIVEAAIDAEAILLGYASIDAQMLARLPNLKIISLLAMGFDNVDIEAAKARSVWVANVPGAATDDVATHALALTLAMLRQLPFYQQSAIDNWSARASFAPPKLSDLTLGLIGLGRIGLRFAEYARPLFGSIVGFDPFVGPQSQVKERITKLGIHEMDMEEVLSCSDVVSLHTPLSEQTRSMANSQFFSQMKPGSYLVNVSRGGLVESVALRAALDSGALSGAGLDTIDQEPPSSNHPLLDHPKVILTPHVAYFSSYTELEYVRQQAANVASWLQDGRPQTPIFDLPNH